MITIYLKINLNKLNPSIVILEYNSLFGFQKTISVPYADLLIEL